MSTKAGIITLGNNSITGQNIRYAIRGSNNNQILILIDGVRISDPSRIDNDFDINFLIVAYRGFSGNEGKPTEEGLYQDARDTLKWLNKQNVEDEKIIIYGESLGTGVSTEVAQNKNYAGLILESPFTSMVDAGKHYYFYLPVSLLLKDRYETIKKLKNIKIPILVMHGKKDTIVPFDMGNEMFLKSKNPKYENQKQKSKN